MACAITLSNYNVGDCFSSKGGIKAAWVAVYADNAFTITSADTVSGFASGITWYKQELRKNTGSLTSTYNYDEANGASFVQTDVVLVYSRMAKESRLQMNALSLGDLILVVEDANGKYYALGAEEPVKATAGTGETGTDRSDRNAYEITLSDYCSKYPYFLDDDAIAALPNA